MKNKSILTSITFFLLTGLTFSQNFDKKSILSDLKTLYHSLEQTHYDLYAYTTKEQFTDNYLKVKKSITQDSLSLQQVTTLFQQVISKANTGHAEIDFPVTAYREYAMNGGTVFPLEIALENGRTFIRKNYSQNKELKAGLEIVAINDIAIQKIIDKIHPQLSAETTYFKNAKLEFWSFPRLYWQIFGQHDSFKVTIKNGEIETEFNLQAVNLIEGYEMKRNDIISPERFFKCYENSIYLKPGNFDGDEEEYKSFIDSVFTEINSKNTKNLIIDLRNNAGGHNAFSDYLVSYFANKPFKWNSKFTIKTSEILKEHTRIYYDTTDSYFKQILAHNIGEIYEYPFEHYEPQPKSKRFKGKVYILINRHTYSMAAVTAAMIQDYNFATIVGEETGDFPTLHASQFSYPLPNTGIVVKVPKGYIIRPNGKKDKRGVIPDISIKDHLVDEKDEILEGFLGALKTENKPDFRIRTITAGVSLANLADTTTILKAITFLNQSKQVFIQEGYEVQTIRISTQSLHQLINKSPDAKTLAQLKKIDQIAKRANVSLSIGEILNGNQYDSALAKWVIQLHQETTNISFSIAISSKKEGIHDKSIKAAAEICQALSKNSKGGEANFRFTASANCPAGIPFFPAAFHEGANSFAIGLESPNLLTKVFSKSNWENAEENLKRALETQLLPIEKMADKIAAESNWKYDGIDTSPAPGLDASIGQAIETLTSKPFGSATTLSACSIITKVLKNLNIKTCGYSGLMLPVIEDKVLAKRAIEKRFTVEELLLLSSVSGTGLDVVPVPGDSSIEVIEGIYRDVAALSLKYANKALSVRLFPIPGKEAGELVEFENPYLTSSTVLELK